jgi:hypothetical protein
MRDADKCAVRKAMKQEIENVTGLQRNKKFENERNINNYFVCLTSSRNGQAVRAKVLKTEMFRDGTQAVT